MPTLVPTAGSPFSTTTARPFRTFRSQVLFTRLFLLGYVLFLHCFTLFGIVFVLNMMGFVGLAQRGDKVAAAQPRC